MHENKIVGIQAWLCLAMHENSLLSWIKLLNLNQTKNMYSMRIKVEIMVMGFTFSYLV